jgi:hypothetical protein
VRAKLGVVRASKSWTPIGSFSTERRADGIRSHNSFAVATYTTWIASTLPTTMPDSNVQTLSLSAYAFDLISPS